MRDVIIGADGAATGSSRFVVCPAAFNAYVAFNARELGATAADRALLRDADELAGLIDELLWDEDTNLWADRPVVGGDGRTHQIPISDGAMPLLVSGRPRARAPRAGDARRSARLRRHPVRADQRRPGTSPAMTPAAYWRGAAWPNMSYLLWLAARRWDHTAIADEIARNTIAGAEASGWAEYWNPETGERTGGRPAVLDRSGGGHGATGARVMPDDPIPVLEIGGTHVTAVLVTDDSWDLVPGSLRTAPVGRRRHRGRAAGRAGRCRQPPTRRTPVGLGRGGSRSLRLRAGDRALPRCGQVRQSLRGRSCGAA